MIRFEVASDFTVEKSDGSTEVPVVSKGKSDAFGVESEVTDDPFVESEEVLVFKSENATEVLIVESE